jgi:hypothetical protein
MNRASLHICLSASIRIEEVGQENLALLTYRELAYKVYFGTQILTKSHSTQKYPGLFLNFVLEVLGTSKT